MKRFPPFSYLLALTIILTLLSCSNVNSGSEGPAEEHQNSPKYIFFFIGDGMGMAQVNLTEAALAIDDFDIKHQSTTENEVYGSMNFTGMPVFGMQTTYAQDRFITGSAAAGTALATGHKTTIGTIGMNGDHTTEFRTMAEMARDKGMKVGIVSSVSIDHATPASFYAHTNSRDNYYSIGQQLTQSGFDYFAGGGVRWNSYDNEGQAEDFNLFLEAAESNGYTYVDTRADFDQLEPGSGKVIATLEKFRTDPSDGAALPYILDLDEYESENDRITLSEFTQKGIELLDNEKGFFMMVEGGKIDWACHANDAASVIHNTIEFDKAIGHALAFYEAHPDETLIIVTADHECGGLTLGYAATKYSTDFSLMAHQNVSYVSFTNRVKEWAEEGNMSFEEALSAAREAYGLGDPELGLELNEKEIEDLKIAFELSMGGEPEKDNKKYGGDDPFTLTLTHILNHKAGITWGSFSHTAVPVPVFAIGQGAEAFEGYYDNTDIAKKIMERTAINSQQ